MTGAALPLALGLLAFVIALVQRPGQEYVDSRLELSANPGLFLERVSQVWSGTGDLGHVHSGQFVGYLLPMGPYYAILDLLGIPMWLVQRLWLGALLAIAAWGAVRLIDALYDDRRGLAHVTAALLFAFNPYVAVLTSRASVALLAHALLPWLLLAFHRGLCEPGRWRWPALGGLLVALSGGGTNATEVAMILPAPVGLVAYEVWALRRPARDAWRFGWRAAACLAGASAWWLVPVLLSYGYAGQFLSFTERPEGIWSTNSMPESLRLLGYWVMYLRIGLDQAVDQVGFAHAYLFSTPVIMAGFAVPLVALAGLRWTARWSYGPFFGLLGAGALVVMGAGFPPRSPPHETLLSIYYAVEPLQVLRTTYKMAPVYALSLAVLAGVALDLLLRASRRGALRIGGREVPPRAFWALLVVPGLFAFPLFTGRAINEDVAYGRIPAYWRDAIRGAERNTTPNDRIMVLPGHMFGAYRWGGGFYDSLLGPGLATRPLVQRNVTRYADARSAELLAAVDDLVQQARLVPGQLEPLLALMGVRQVLVSTDGRRPVSLSLDPVDLERSLSEQRGFHLPVASYGTTRRYGPEFGRSGPDLALPDLRRYAPPALRATGIVRVHPTGGATVLDGDGQGVTDLAAVGGLDPSGVLFYAGDLPQKQLVEAARGGGRLVFTDSNRRRGIANRTTDAQGPTVETGEPLGRSWPRYEPFPSYGDAARTVAEFDGLRYLRAPLEPGLFSFPQHRAYAAIDGRLDTSWIATVGEPSEPRYLELGLREPRRLGWIGVYPHSDALGATRQIRVSVNGRRERKVSLRSGWTRIALGGKTVRSIRLRVALVQGPSGARGGLAEVRVPGVKVREALRLPTVLARHARNLNLSRAELMVLLRRTTADDPYRAGANIGSAQAGSPFDMVDAEPGLERIVTLPQARSFDSDGWATVDPAAPDNALDRLTGMPGGWRFTSSSRFEGLPSRRASSAFDGRTETAWVGDLLPRRRPWLKWEAPRAVRIDRLRLVPGPDEYAFPTRLRIRGAHGFVRTARVASNGTVRLGATVRSRRLRLDILSTRVAPRAAQGLRGVAVSEVQVPRLRPPHPRRSGSFATRCGAIAMRTDADRAELRVSGTVARLDAGRPLRMASCGPQRRLPLVKGRNRLSTALAGVLRPDHVRLRSPAPKPVPPLARPGRVLGAKRADAATVPQDVSLDVRAPAWLVLGESYASGWRATCRKPDGERTDLGTPLPADGFANAWRLPAGCRSVSFRFAPQRVANVSYLISGLVLLVLLAICVAGWWRARRARQADHVATVATTVEPEEDFLAADRPRSVPLPTALAIGALAGLIGAFGLAIRFGVVIGPLTVLALLVGINVRRLVAAAAAGVVAVTLLYVVDPPADPGGPRFDFALSHMLAHWIAVGLVWCLAVASALAAWQRRQRTPAEGPALGEASTPTSLALPSSRLAPAPPLWRLLFMLAVLFAVAAALTVAGVLGALR